MDSGSACIGRRVLCSAAERRPVPWPPLSDDRSLFRHAHRKQYSTAVFSNERYCTLDVKRTSQPLSIPESEASVGMLIFPFPHGPKSEVPPGIEPLRPLVAVADWIHRLTQLHM